MKNKSKFLDLFFKDGESVCVSPNQFAHYSVKKADILQHNVLKLTTCGKKEFEIDADVNRLELCSINPTEGRRSDQNVTAFRSFLVEIDDGSFSSQMEYVKKMGMPYSVCIFSGNKSLHFGIVLEEDLPSIDYWKFICQWILNVMSFADQQTKNPTRGIRFPDMIRGNGNKQKLIEFKNKVNINDLLDWLEKFPDKKPKKKKKIEYNPLEVNINDFKSIPPFVMDKLKEGIDSERNKEWFNLTCVLARKLWTEEETVAFLSQYFVPESDFSEIEWKTCIRSAFKTVIGD